MVAIELYAGKFALPALPVVNLIFKLLKEFSSGLKKFSSDAFHDTPIAGKKPHLLLAPVVEAPSSLPVSVTLYLCSNEYETLPSQLFHVCLASPEPVTLLAVAK